MAYNLGYPKDKPLHGETKWATVKGADGAQWGAEFTVPLVRNRSTAMHFARRSATFEIFKKKGLFGSSAIAKCAVELAPLLTQCEVDEWLPFCKPGPGRTTARQRGELRVGLAVHSPLKEPQTLLVERRTLQVGPWPVPVSARTGAAALAAPAPAAAAPAAAAPAAPAAAPSPAAAARFASVPETERASPHDPSLLVSNNVLDAEIEATVGDDLNTVVRRTLLQGRVDLLVAEVQSGKLDMPGYCARVSQRLRKDQLLALWLREAGRRDDALRVLKRAKAMKAELAGVEAAEGEGEG